MPLVAMTVRFDAAAYQVVKAEAHAAGVPISQFVREASLIRAYVRATGRAAPGLPLDIARLAAEVERRARV